MNCSKCGQSECVVAIGGKYQYRNIDGKLIKGKCPKKWYCAWCNRSWPR